MQPYRSQDRPDFPFHCAPPLGLSGPQWAVVLAALGVASGLLVAPWTIPAAWGAWIPALLFCAVPLAALACVAGRRWTALFHRMTGRDVRVMVGIAMLNLAVTLLLGVLFNGVLHASANPVFRSLDQADATTRAVTLLMMVPQLLGEELLTILPFLALLAWLHRRLGLARRTAVVLAWLLSALPFALLHLPTYGWNVLQCVLFIGTARLVLSLAYLRTRNLWVSTGAHVLNDWTLVGASLLAGSLTH